MKGLVVGGLILSAALAVASVALKSRSPDGLEKALEEHGIDVPEEASEPFWRVAFRTAAGATLVFTIIVGLGSLRKRSKGASRVHR
ncbi:MAG: hypothetical protein O7H41_02490 [Planctomycetota bacterium]|nr:hypothetical protein [Planctomycetota bacterium]